MCSYGLQQVADDESVASFPQAVASSLTKLVVHRLAASCFNKL